MLCAAAKRLQEMGLVKHQVREFVCCADSQDSDFPPRNRYCRGRVYLTGGLDESGDEFRCPECERPVFPFRHGKRRHRELHTRVCPDGVKSYIAARLAELDANAKEAWDAVYQVGIGPMGVAVCIADYCAEEPFLGRDWARTHAACYVVVNPKALEERFLDEGWLTRVSLADVVCGEVDLEAVLRELATASPPRSVLNVSVPVYSKGAPPVRAEPLAPPQKGRRFVVEVGPKTVRVEGEIVVAPQAGTRFHIFRILWERFLDDLREGRAPDDFRPITVDVLGKELERRTKQPFEDVTTVRRAVNRLQADIETAVKRKLGSPIGREDIIQTCRWKGVVGEEDHGYRLNPFRVAIRPFAPAPPEELS